MNREKRIPEKDVYVYLAMTSIDRTSLVKVGVSGHPERRLTTLQNGCPLPIHAMYAALFKTRSVALAAEHLVHARLSGWRSSGEWFRFGNGQGVEVVFEALDVACKQLDGGTVDRVSVVRHFNFN